jgi:hypothetical protein
MDFRNLQESLKIVLNILFFMLEVRNVATSQKSLPLYFQVVIKSPGGNTAKGKTIKSSNYELFPPMSSLQK